MTSKNRLRFYFYGFAIFGLLIFNFCRGIWHPVYLKLTGKKTESQVFQEIGTSAERKLHAYFNRAGVSYLPDLITLIALKNERKLELWATTAGEHHLPVRSTLIEPCAPPWESSSPALSLEIDHA